MLLATVARRGDAWEGVGEVLELDFCWAGVCWQEIDGEDVETDGDGGAMGLGQAAQIGGGHAAELVLLVAVDLGFGRSDVMRGAGFDLEDDQGGAVPGDEVEVAGEAAGAPAAGDDGVAKRAQMEEGGGFSALAGEEMERFGANGGIGVAIGAAVGFAVGAGAEGGVEAAFEIEDVTRDGQRTPL